MHFLSLSPAPALCANPPTAALGRSDAGIGKGDVEQCRIFYTLFHPVWLDKQWPVFCCMFTLVCGKCVIAVSYGNGDRADRECNCR